MSLSPGYDEYRWMVTWTQPGPPVVYGWRGGLSREEAVQIALQKADAGYIDVIFSECVGYVEVRGPGDRVIAEF